MPSVESKARELKNRFYKAAPKANQPKIEEVINVYKSGRNVNFRTVENVVIGLYSPTIVGEEEGRADVSGLP